MPAQQLAVCAQNKIQGHLQCNYLQMTLDFIFIYTKAMSQKRKNIRTLSRIYTFNILHTSSFILSTSHTLV